MATSRTATGKKTISKIATSKPATPAPAKKPLTKKVIAKSTAAKKPGAKKPAAKTIVTAKKTSVPKITKPLPAASKAVSKSTVAPEERYKMIAAAAYLRAERRGFASGHALDDWIAAEVEIDALLKA